MKHVVYFILFILLGGCIEQYMPKDIENINDLLVVEGAITNDESVFKLSRSVGLLDTLLIGKNEINDALVYVEKDDGERLQGAFTSLGTYVVPTGALDAQAKYRFCAVVGGEEYRSDFLSPLFTPEIDSISLTKRGRGEPVYVCVTTRDPLNQSRYFRWSYEENWEIKAELFANYGKLDDYFEEFTVYTDRNTYYCWMSDQSKSLILGSTDKLAENVIYQKRLNEIACDNSRLSVLYFVRVRQLQIRKEAYDYYSNLQKNVEQTGSIFSPVPSEINGNIRCVTNPSLPVIGYIDVSTTVVDSLFHDGSGLYEPFVTLCVSSITDDPKYAYPVYAYYQMDMFGVVYAPHACVDCRLHGGIKKRPDFWPNNHR